MTREGKQDDGTPLIYQHIDCYKRRDRTITASKAPRLNGIYHEKSTFRDSAH